MSNHRFLQKTKWLNQAGLIGTFLFSIAACQSSDCYLHDYSNETKNIKNLFTEWQINEIKAGRFWAADSCNPGWFELHDIQQNLDFTKGLKYGFPSDSNEYSYSFGDINSDGRLDGLVLFNPTQCDGGNASMWIQWQVFILSSDDDRYVVTDTINFRDFAGTGFDDHGFYWLDSISMNTVFGTYIEFKEDDGRCCPSIRKQVMFDFYKRKVNQ